MAKSTVLIAMLAIALAGTNAWWAYNAIDAGISRTYQGVSLEDNREALRQTIAIISEIAKLNANRESIIRAAAVPGDNSEPLEKEGFVWVGKIGLRFDEAGELVEAVPGWSPQ